MRGYPFITILFIFLVSAYAQQYELTIGDFWPKVPAELKWDKSIKKNIIAGTPDFVETYDTISVSGIACEEEPLVEGNIEFKQKISVRFTNEQYKDREYVAILTLPIRAHLAGFASLGLCTGNTEVFVTFPNTSSEISKFKLQQKGTDYQEARLEILEIPFLVKHGQTLTIRTVQQASMYAEKGESSSMSQAANILGVQPMILFPYLNTFSVDQQYGVSGVAADGKSKCLARILPNAFRNAYELSAPAPEDGKIELKESAYSYKTYQYTPPSYYCRPGHAEDAQKEKREILFKCKVLDVEGYVWYPTTPFYLIKPPVLLLHGLWADSSTWAQMESMLKDNHFKYVVNPAYDNSTAFADNSKVVKTQVEKIRQKASSEGYVTQCVDVVAHSMGGLITKLYGSSDMIHSITTVGTPHLGSPCADVLYKMANTPGLGTLVIKGMASIKHHVDRGAIRDLRVDGGIHCTANQIPVPIYVAAGSAYDMTSTPQLILAMVNFALFFDIALTHAMLFGSDQSDWIVSLKSQGGGVTPDYIAPKTWHCAESTNPQIQQKILTFLHRTSDQQFEFMPQLQFIPKADQPKALSIEFPAFKVSRDNQVKILSPLPKQAFRPGDKVTVSISAPSQTTKAFFMNSNLQTIIKTTTPYTWQFTIPTDWQGPMNILASARSNDELLGIAEVTIEVNQ